MKKVAFYTLGCKLNFSETSTISRQFEEKGFLKVDFQENPDIFIINTCSVTDNADKKCKKLVKEAKKISPDSYVAIIGCYAQLKPTEIAEIEGVDAVLGAAEKFRLLELLDGFAKEQETKVLASEISAANSFETSYSLHDRTRTFLKVQDGCNYGCAFCTIPLARGKSRSSTIPSILASTRDIAGTEVKEVVLTGVNIGDFGIVDGKRDARFADLVMALDEVEGIARFRISSIEPNLLTNEIIDWVAKSKHFMPHFHVPLQSGSDRVLGLMRRRYRRDLYAERVTRIKERMPHACIGVDVIVGSPGETEADFRDTIEFLTELDISYLHVFPYSERANTYAVDIFPKVDGMQKAERSKMLHILSDKKRHAFYESQLNKVGSVLFEESTSSGFMEGFSENYVRVSAPYDPLLINTIQPVRYKAITDSGDVKGEVLLVSSQ